MGESSGDTFSGAFDYLMSTSSAHGLPNVQRSKTILSKTIWSMLFLGSVTALLIQVITLSNTFFEYNYTVSLDVKFDRSLHFPAVTICNYNPVLRSKLADASEEFRTAFDVNFVPPGPPNEAAPSGQQGGIDGSLTTETSETQSSGGTDHPNSGPNSGSQQVGTAGLANPNPTTLNPTTASTSSPGTNASTATTENVTEALESWDDREQGDFFRERDPSYLLEQTLITELANITEQERMMMGHSLSTMLLDCKWKGYPCSPSNFTSFYHYKYGNCYTFNHFTKGDLFTNRPGPLYGLSMRLFVQQDEYMPDITESAGFRLVVHGPDKMPFPEDDGIAISPGFQTAVAARIMNIERLGGLYSNCSDSPKSNDIFKEVYNTTYSLKACERSCYQNQVIKECKCFDPHYPNLPDSGVFPCELTDEKAIDCLTKLDDMYKNDSLQCDCYQACSETTYLTSVSSSVWPADKYEDKLFRDIIDRNEEVRTNLRKTSPGEWVKRNVAKVDVFFQEFNYQYIKQLPAYAFVNLISDVGGQLGLWLGLSVLTMFEFVESCGFLFRVCFAKMARRKKTTCTPVKNLKIFPVDNRGVSLEQL
ncbi:degenerin mec-4-like [Asterias rubens]|uniref:degenerin mec-4-like n=1 Tax=Asterias rubens TaxID=7604 RepID=UPI0014554F84|nr:degenerin mec-4-like [Asterias rubens]